MFKQDVTTNYNLEDATLEIVIMLLVAFVLGYLFRYFSTPKTVINVHTDESKVLLEQLGKTQNELKKSIEEKAELKKSITIEYNARIEELKIKLADTRASLEQCLSVKAANSSKKESSKKISDPKLPNDLKIIEGIGPALAKLLNQAGIETYEQLAQSTEENLRLILSNAGSRYKVHDPSSWPNQARLAAGSNWDELKLFQKQLNSKNT